MPQKLLNRHPEALIAELVIAANPDFTFDFTGILVSDAAVNGNSAYPANTRAKLSPKPGITPPLYRETSYIWYDRIELSDFFRNMTPVLLIDDTVQSTKDLIPLIQATYGIVFPENSYLDTPIVRGEVYPYPHTVEMASNSLAWKGTGDFLLRDATIDIDSLIDDPVLDGLRFPFYTANRIQGLLYSYNLNCTAIRGLLTSLSVDDAVGQLAPDFSNVAPTPWVNAAEPTENNLYGATVLATGTTAELIAQGYPINPKFTNAVVVKLSLEQCINYGGVLLFQFN